MPERKNITRIVGAIQKGRIDEFCPCSMYETMKQKGLITDYRFEEKDREFTIIVDMKVYAPIQPIHYVSLSVMLDEKVSL